MPRTLCPLVVLSALMAVPACDRATAPSVVATRDSAGIAIIEIPIDPAVPTWRIAAEPAVTIGDMAAGEAYELYRPIHALRLDDGRIAIANQGTNELRFYGPDGRHLRTVGRRGGGPGEYQDMWGLVRLPGDSLGVWDWTARRLTIYDGRGTLGRLVTPVHDVGFVPRLLGAFEDGSFVVIRGFNPGAVFARGGGVLDDSLALLRFSADDGALVDSLGPYPGDQRYVHMGDGQFWMRRIPFGRAERLAIAAGRIHVGDDRDGEVRSYRPDGDLSRILRPDFRPRPVTDQRLTRYREHQLDDVPPDRLQEERRRVERTPAADVLPAFADLFADRLGRIWLREERDEVPEAGGRWIVHDADGLPSGRVRLPRRVQPVDAGVDYVLVYGRDDLDVERIQLFPMTASEDPQ